MTGAVLEPRSSRAPSGRWGAAGDSPALYIACTARTHAPRPLWHYRRQSRRVFCTGHDFGRTWLMSIGMLDQQVHVHEQNRVDRCQREKGVKSGLRYDGFENARTVACSALVTVACALHTGAACRSSSSVHRAEPDGTGSCGRVSAPSGVRCTRCACGGLCGCNPSTVVVPRGACHAGGCSEAESAEARAARSARVAVACCGGSVRALGTRGASGSTPNSSAAVARGTHRARRCSGSRSARTRGAVARATRSAGYGINVAVRALSASMTTTYDIRCAASVPRGTDRARALT